MLPAVALAGKNVPSEIKLMQALHNNDLYACCGIIDTTAKGGIKAQIDRFPFYLTYSLLRVERIVKYKNVTAHASSGGLHSGGEHDAALRILIMAFDVLIARERENSAPIFLIPRGLNNAAT